MFTAQANAAAGPGGARAPGRPGRSAARRRAQAELVARTSSRRPNSTRPRQGRQRRGAEGGEGAGGRGARAGRDAVAAVKQREAQSSRRASTWSARRSARRSTASSSSAASRSARRWPPACRRPSCSSSRATWTTCRSRRPSTRPTSRACAPGQKASFTIDAFPGRTFDGAVKQVRKAALSPERGDLHGRRRLRQPGPAAARHDGQRADRHRHRDNVLKVPNAALRVRLAGVEPAGAACAAAARATRSRRAKAPERVGGCTCCEDGSPWPSTCASASPTAP